MLGGSAADLGILSAKGELSEGSTMDVRAE